MKVLWIATLVCVAGCSLSPDPRQMVRVGYMERDCSRVRNSQQIPAIPIGLTVTPVEAARSLPHGCVTKFFVDVYADEDHYYFFDNTPALFSLTRTAEEVKACSYVVDGHSGVLIRLPEQYWRGLPYPTAVVSISHDGREIEVIQRPDVRVRRVAVLSACGDPRVGEARIRAFIVRDSQIEVIYGKHCEARVSLADLSVECSGCD